MTRQMPDACTPANIPDGFALVAYYVDGGCAAPPVKGTRHVGISSLATDAGVVGDCEPENPPPATWVGWVQRRRAAGVDPTIYCADDSLSDFFAGYRHRDVRAAFQAARVPEPHYWLTLPGATAIPAGAVAVQNQTGLDGDRYDLSLVAPYWPGVDPPEEELMTLDPSDPIVQELRLNAATAARVVSATDAAKDDSGNPIDLHWTAGYILGHVRAVQAQVGQLLGDDQAVAQAIAALMATTQAQGGTLQAVQGAVAALKDQIAAGGDPGAAAAIERIEKALQGA